MASFVDDAIVLRRVNYGEADRVLTVLTREHGKVGVIARGSRKAGAKMASQTDLLAQARMQFSSGRGSLLTLTQAQLTSTATVISDPIRMACAGLIAEMADAVLETDHADSDAYDLIAAAISDALTATADPRTAVIWCARRLIDRLGYSPELWNCVGCREQLPEAIAWFSASGGGLLCHSCAVYDATAIECTVRAIKVLRCVSHGDAELYHRLRLDDDTITTLENVVERELAHHLERRLRSLDVVRALRHN